MSISRKINKAADNFGNRMADIKDFGDTLQQLPERAVKGTLRGTAKVPVALAKGGADVGLGVLKEFSGILAHAGREITGAKKNARRVEAGKKWFD